MVVLRTAEGGFDRVVREWARRALDLTFLHMARMERWRGWSPPKLEELAVTGLEVLEERYREVARMTGDSPAKLVDHAPRSRGLRGR